MNTTHPNTRAYDIFKAIVAGILALIAIWLLLNGHAAGATTKTSGATVAPVLNAPSINPDGSLTLTGTGQPDAAIDVQANGIKLGTAQVNAEGNWSLNSTLPPGFYSISANTVDAKGTVVNASKALDFTVPEVAVAAPTVVVPTLDTPTVTADGKLALAGTAAPGAVVEIDADGAPLGTATAGADGRWAFEAALPAGDHQLAVRTLDIDGKALTESEPLAFTVPEVTAPVVAAPRLDNPTLTVDGKLTLTGTATPNAAIEIDANGATLGKTSAGADGNWSLEAELPAGDYDLAARIVDAAGNVVAASEPLAFTMPEVAAPADTAVLSVTLPITTPAAGEITLSGVGAPDSTVDLSVDGDSAGTAQVGADGNWQIAALFPKAGSYQVQATMTDAAGKLLDETEPVDFVVGPALPTFTAAAAADGVSLTGTGEPGAEVDIVVDGQSLGAVTVAADGTWSFLAQLGAGTYDIAVRMLDTAGQPLNQTETVTVQGPTASSGSSGSGSSGGSGAAPAGQAYIVKEGDWLTKIALELLGDIEAYTRIIDATNAKVLEDPSFTVITDPDSIEVGQKLWIPAQ